MKLSCVVPILNEEDNVKNFLEGYVTQTEKFHELIFIDGNSKDKTQKIIKEYMKKNKEIKLVICDRKGPAAARNEGLNNATGDYVTFMDADVKFLEKNVIEKIKEKTKDVKKDVYKFKITYNQEEIPKTYKGFRKYIYLKENYDFLFYVIKIKISPKWDEELGFGEDSVFYKEVEKLNIQKFNFYIKEINICKREGDMNLTKLLRRNMWYGRTIPIFIYKTKNKLQIFRYIIFIICTIPIFWLFPFIRGFFRGIKYINYGIDIPFGMGIVEIVKVVGIGLGFFQWLFGIRHIGRDKT